MGDLLLELLFSFLELVFEALFESALAAIFDLLVRAFSALFASIEIKNSILALTGYTLLGAAAGALSLFIIPHPLFRPSRFHGISLLASPALTGLGMGSSVYGCGQKPGRCTKLRVSGTDSLSPWA